MNSLMQSRWVFLIGILLLRSPAWGQEQPVSAADQAMYRAISEAYESFEDGQPGHAYATLEEAIEAKGLSPEALISGRRVLAWLYAEGGEHAKAIDVYDDLMDETEDSLDLGALLNQRARSWKALGNDELAENDSQLSKQLMEFALRDRESSDGLFFDSEEEGWEGILDWIPGELRGGQGSATAVLSVHLAVWSVLFFLNILAGWRQSREGQGTLLRLLGVAAYVAGLQILPLVALAGLLRTGLLGTETSQQTGTATVCFLYAGFWVMMSMRPTLRPMAGKEPLPFVEEPGFAERLQEIADTLGIKPPVARQLNSGGGSMPISAFAGGLPAPSIVVSDGVLLRLAPLERDAIVAHELGHIANRSLWAYPAVPALAGLVAVLVSVRLPFLSSVLFGMAVQVGLFRIVSRYFEYSSDRHAAKAIGVAETIAALEKTHVASPVGTKGWWPFFAYSTATHPSMEERLSALKQLAPPGEEIPATWSESAAGRRGLGARVAGAIWLAVLIGLVAMPQTDIAELAAIPILLGVAFGPFLLIQRAIRKDVKSELKRRQNSASRISSGWLIAAVISLVFLSTLFAEDSLGDLKQLIVTVTVFGLTIFFGAVLLGAFMNRRNPHIRMIQAMQQRKWDEAVELGESALKKWNKDPAPRNDLALAKWMAGLREEAVSDLAKLRVDFPKFKQLWITSALVRMDEGDLRRAAELALEATEDLKNDAAPHVIAARCYRLQGDLEQLKEQTETINNIDPECSSATALAMLVNMLEERPDEAWKKLEETETQSPGDPFVFLLRAEMEHRFGDQDKAKQSLNEAKRLLDASPLAFLNPEYQFVSQLLTDSRPPPPVS